MINLIPPHAQTALKHEYVLRVVSVYGFIFALILAAGSALAVPTYVLLRSQLEAARADSSQVSETRIAYDTAFTEISIANTIMSKLQTNEKKATYSPLIEEIVRVAPQGISFSTFQGAHVNGELHELQVQGSAVSRNVLAEFRNTLEASPLFLKAAVPISDLARDTNLSFLITITLEKEQTL